MRQQYELTLSPLYCLHNKRKLEQLLGMPKYTLNKLSSIVAYHSFQIPKKDGTFRDITAPDDQLKKYQKKLLKLLSRIHQPNWLISGCKGKSYPDNARYHQGSNYCLTIDIQSFYPNCKREYVFNLFYKTFKMSKDVAGVISDLTTHDGIIPTGCPTSQLLAFMGYYQMFYKIKQLAENENCIFTVYVDDVTFSSSVPIAWHKMAYEVNCILHQYGHKLKLPKVKYYSKQENKLITGVILNRHHNILVPNHLRYQIVRDKNNLLQNDDTIPENVKQQTRSSLLGRLLCARNIEHGIYPELYKSIRTSKL